MKAAACCGLGCVVLFFVGFWAVAQFIPPPSPLAGAQEVADRFRGDENRIRAGLIMCMFAVALMGPWVAALTVQMRRIEGRNSVLAFTQLALGAILVLEFIYLTMFWQVATFRPDRSPEAVQLLNDMAWLPFIALVGSVVIQAAVIGIAILGDHSFEPVFPRWAGYFNLWCALMFTPGSVTVFFKDGPLAWNGIIAWYLPLAAFGIWVATNAWLLFQSAGRLGANGAAPAARPVGDPLAEEVKALAAELAQVRGELAELAGRAS